MSSSSVADADCDAEVVFLVISSLSLSLSLSSRKSIMAFTANRLPVAEDATSWQRSINWCMDGVATIRRAIYNRITTPHPTTERERCLADAPPLPSPFSITLRPLSLHPALALCFSDGFSDLRPKIYLR